MKQILKYFGLVVLDIIGAITVLFFSATHFILIFFILKDLYVFTIREMEKSNKKASGLLKGILIAFYIFIGVIVWGLSYSFYAHLIAPHGI